MAKMDESLAMRIDLGRKVLTLALLDSGRSVEHFGGKAPYSMGREVFVSYAPNGDSAELRLWYDKAPVVDFFGTHFDQGDNEHNLGIRPFYGIRCDAKLTDIVRDMIVAGMERENVKGNAVVYR